MVAKATPKYTALLNTEIDFLRNHITPNTTVLDIGCGAGRVISAIVDVTPYVTGIDTDAHAIEQTGATFANMPDVNITKGSAFAIPFEDYTFDFVLLMMTFVNFAEKKQQALQEMKRVLASKGSMIMSVYSDKAFEERKKLYEIVEAPIKEILGTTFVFDESLGANESEQFSYQQFDHIMQTAGLHIVDHVETDIGFIFEIKRVY